MAIHGRAGATDADHAQPAAGLRSLLVPVWLRDYHGDWLQPDIIAGLTAAAVVIPQALAYATVAGLSALTLLVGAVLILAAVLRLGFIANFIGCASTCSRWSRDFRTSRVARVTGASHRE